MDVEHEGCAPAPVPIIIMITMMLKIMMLLMVVVVDDDDDFNEEGLGLKEGGTTGSVSSSSAIAILLLRHLIRRTFGSAALYHIVHNHLQKNMAPLCCSTAQDRTTTYDTSAPLYQTQKLYNTN